MKGQWKIHNDSDDWRRIRLEQEGWGIVALVWIGTDVPEQTARLFAMAPVLAQALELLLMATPGLLEHDLGECGKTECPLCQAKEAVTELMG